MSQSESESQCPACAAHRLHVEGDWSAYHPLKGHGYQSGQGWSSPELEAEFEQRSKAQ
jgi:hypothetical protein